METAILNIHPSVRRQLVRGLEWVGNECGDECRAEPRLSILKLFADFVEALNPYVASTFYGQLLRGLWSHT